LAERSRASRISPITHDRGPVSNGAADVRTDEGKDEGKDEEWVMEWS
jgi:hypothetical protein